MKISFTASEIASFLGGSLRGDGGCVVGNIAPLESAVSGDLSFLSDAKYVPVLERTGASVVLVSKDIEIPSMVGATLIVVENARLSVGHLLTLVEQTLNPRREGVEQPSYVSSDVELPEGVYVGAFAYVGKGVRLGKGVQIYPQAYIGDGVTIGENTIVYAGAKIYPRCTVGSHCILHAGCVIGADGFGFEPDADGVNRKIPQVGTVVIEDDVEIGANSAVDRAMMGSTVIHSNVKIDDLVMLGHNVEVGESSILCAQVGVAGSTKLGKHNLLTGQVGVAGHLTIADGCTFGAQSGVSGNIREKGVYMGSPAMDVWQWKRMIIAMKRLPEMVKNK